MQNQTQSWPNFLIRAATNDDLPQLQLIRQAAFTPVFASFRAILGDEIAAVTQANDDAEQADYLASLFAPDSGWELYTAVLSDKIVGFVSVQLNDKTGVGEIGLNAVHPEAAGQGIGTALYQFALDRMKAAGMRVATVGTGGDPSHAPARRAYEKVGFSAQIPSVYMYRLL
ncbi:MAG: GNAT family N-acetyltransferase [Anaerolineaceae bacterium]|nr:GNAT family N-acetyltransferase [Anaerolineaceae bacterium]